MGVAVARSVTRVCRTLRKLKSIVQWAVYVAHNVRLETALMYDSCMMAPKVAVSCELAVLLLLLMRNTHVSCPCVAHSHS